MPSLSHIWQRFVQALALVVGLVVGVTATVFGYSNTGTVTVSFSVWRLSGVPLWSVALAPLGVMLVLGALYHWWNSLHHFTQHMSYRRRVRELEAEVAALKGHLDQVLEMPDQGATPEPAARLAAESAIEEAAPLTRSKASASNGGEGKSRRAAMKKSEPLAGADGEANPAPETTEEANSKA